MARSLILFALLLGVVSCALAQDWPHWRGPNDTGIVSVAPINEDWTTKTPPVLWTVPMYDGGFSSPSVVGGKVYILDHKTNNDIIRCLDLQTGTELWETPYPEREGETRCTVSVGGGKVFAFSRNAVAACVDATTGKLIWMRDLKKDYNGGPPAAFGFASSPLIDGKQVIFCPGNKDGATVVALDVETGKEIWRGGSEETGYGTPEIATLGGVRQYLVFTGSALISLNPETGEEYWRYEWRERENCNGNAPVVIGDDVLIESGYDHGFALLDVSKGTEVSLIWKYGPNNRAWGSKICSPVVYKGCIYTTSENLNLGCLDLKTGKELWAQWVFGDTGVTIVNDVIFAVKSPDCILYMVRATPDKYTELGEMKPLPTGDIAAAPVFADGKLLLRNRKALACIDLSPDAQPAPPAARPVTPPPPTTGLPDLIVTKLLTDPATPKAGDAVTFSAEVKNQGTASTPDWTTIGVRFLVDTPTPVIWSDNEDNALAPGKSVVVTATGGTAGATWTATTGTHTVTVIVDDVNRIAESNEDNNTLTATVTVP